MTLELGEPGDPRARLGASLIGRAGELESLERLLQEVDGSRAGVVEVVGEPGIGKTRALVVVLDDVHRADPASVELLAALLRRPPTAAVLIAVGVRPRQLPERLSAALERAHRAGALTRIEVGALTRAEARELVGDEADALDGESGGNPFFLEQLARALDRDGGAAIRLPMAAAWAKRALAAAAVADEAGAPVEAALDGLGARRYRDAAERQPRTLGLARAVECADRAGPAGSQRARAAAITRGLRAAGG